jgi:predicted nucleic acid-binding protein
MIAYFDASALVPLLISEPGSARARQLWSVAPVVASARIAYAEVGAALAQAHRMKRLTEGDFEAAMEKFEGYWQDLSVLEVGDALVREAARLAHSQGLRAYDAVHCAAAAQLTDMDCVAVAGDRALLDGWSSLGLVTIDLMA